MMRFRHLSSNLWLQVLQIALAARIGIFAAGAAMTSHGEVVSSEPPSRELAYVSTRSGKATIWLSDENGNNARELTPNHPGTIDIGWSPDGETMFFATQLSGNLTMEELDHGPLGLYSLDMRTGETRQLTKHDALYRYPEMSPDGKSVVFLSDRETGERQVWVMDPDGSNPRRITSVPGHKSRPTFNPDGSLIALQINNPNAQIYLMQPDGSNLRNISNNQFSERYPSWSGDGKRLTFTSIRKGEEVSKNWLEWIGWKLISPITGRMRAVWLMDLDGQHQKPTLEFPSESKHADFSPTGDEIAFESDLTGQNQIYITDSTGKNPRQVTFMGANFKPVFRPRHP